GPSDRARTSRFDDRLEELTPELSDLPNRVGDSFQSYDGRLRGHLGHALGRDVGDAFRVDPDDPVVPSPPLHDQRAHRGGAFEPAGARDLEPVARDNVAADD